MRHRPKPWQRWQLFQRARAHQRRMHAERNARAWQFIFDQMLSGRKKRKKKGGKR